MLVAEGLSLLINIYEPQGTQPMFPVYLIWLALACLYANAANVSQLYDRNINVKMKQSLINVFTN